jgi:hypothetical protein
MTVKDLITELSRLPEEMNVYTEGKTEIRGQDVLNPVWQVDVINVENYFGYKLLCITEVVGNGILIS